VAYNRALGILVPQVPRFSDPLAADLLPDNCKAKLRRAEAALPANPRKSPYPFWLRGMGLLNQFRTVVLDPRSPRLHPSHNSSSSAPASTRAPGEWTPS